MMKIKAFNYVTGYFQEQSMEFTEENPSKCVIGRHPNCDFVLNSPEVSRIHGIILYQEQKYYYIDLASTDGSKINNIAASVNQSILLKLGDIIRIGDFIVLLEYESTILQSDTQVLCDSNTFIRTNTNPQEGQTEFIVKCCNIIEETDNVKTFFFVAEPPILFNDISFNYKPGQFVMLDLEIAGKRVKRPYSISSTPSRPYNLQITVKRVSAPQNQPDLSPGLVSNWLHDYFKVGDQLKISPPMGDFNYFENSHKKLLFISAGSGIAPLMSMSRWLCDTNANVSVIFIYSARTQEDIIFREELELMAATYSNFQLTINLTGNDFDLNWTGKRGRLNETMLLEIAPDVVERIAYVCGSQSFLESVQTMLGKLNFPMDNYYQENFGLSKAVKTASIPNSPATVVFSKSEIEVICDADETILEAAQREGISLPYGCQMGVCGQCKLRKVSGKVSYDQDFGCENDYVLTCVAKAVEDVVIEG